MNFKKLQEMQRALDNAILKEKPEMKADERFEKTCVALSVEIAELANTAEHFKFWKDNKGKIDGERFLDIYNSSNIKFGTYYDKKKKQLWLTSEQAHKLTLVEEASDCLHFILSLANQIDFEIDDFEYITAIDSKEQNLMVVNKDIFYLYNGFKDKKVEHENFRFMLMGIYSYFKKLGITQEELEQAYYDKNEINYQRLREGY